jgi:hypothetical protein
MGLFVKSSTISGTFMTGASGSVFIAPSATGPLSPLLQLATSMAPTLTFVTLGGATYTITAFDGRTSMGLGTISAVIPVQLGLTDGTTSFYLIKDTFTLPEPAHLLALGPAIALLIWLSRLRRRRVAA